MDRVNIGLIGFGVVGQGVYRVLEENRQQIARRMNLDLRIRRIAVRDVTRQRAVEVPGELLTADPYRVIDDPEIDIVAELVGGQKAALEYVMAALERGKHVVTANKELMANHGPKVFEAAEAAGVGIAFEAAVGGGIPIIRALKESLAANQISRVMGIINGTTNYILSKMSREGVDFAACLKEAQARGYAEADPTDDIDGHDAARKIAILASIAFGARVFERDVYREGIGVVHPEDIRYGRELGWTIKPLAIAKRDREKIEVRVHPTFIPDDHPLASINDVFNAVFVEGNAVGETMFYGRGAGSRPTASAVLGDIIYLARHFTQDSLPVGCTCREEPAIRPIEDVVCKYYLRLLVHDRPGVMARIARCFGDNDISLNSVIQKASVREDAEIVMVTHDTVEGYIRRTLGEMRSLDCVKAVRSVIRIEDNGGDRA